MTRRVYQYLESLDSASTPWTEPGAVDDAGKERQAIHQLQVFLEVLMTLALGRDVVVPQSYAFDSWGFLQVARTVLDARGPGAADEHPFALHLSGAQSYDEAVSGMLARVRDRHRPMVSSLLPELHDRAVEPRLPRDIGELLQRGWLSTDRAGALDVVRAEFSRLPRLRANPRPDPVGLSQLLAQFAGESSAMTQLARSYSEPFREVHQDLIDAVRRLDPTHRNEFRQRSRLRMRKPWPGDPQRRTPEEIVGREKLDLVIEFVDTLYNTVVADNIGVAPVTFTTDLALGGRPLMARAIAQDLALAGYAAMTGGSLPSLAAAGRAEESLETAPLFEARFDARKALTHPAVREDVKRLSIDAVDGLSALLEQRAARGGTGHPRSPFWERLDKLNAAIADKDAPGVRKALDAHITGVAKILRPNADVGLTSNWRIQLSLTGASAASSAAATATWHMPALPSAGLTALGSVAGPLATHGTEAVKSWKRSRRLAHALGGVVNIRWKAR